MPPTEEALIAEAEPIVEAIANEAEAVLAEVELSPVDAGEGNDFDAVSVELLKE